MNTHVPPIFFDSSVWHTAEALAQPDSVELPAVTLGCACVAMAQATRPRHISHLLSCMLLGPCDCGQETACQDKSWYQWAAQLDTSSCSHTSGCKQHALHYVLLLDARGALHKSMVCMCMRGSSSAIILGAGSPSQEAGYSCQIAKSLPKPLRPLPLGKLGPAVLGQVLCHPKVEPAMPACFAYSATHATNDA